MNEEEIIKDLLKQSQEDVEIWKDLYNQEKEKNKKLEEVIDMMAEEIFKITKVNDISNYLEQFSNYDIDFVKQYYFKKARGEEDEKS